MLRRLDALRVWVENLPWVALLSSALFLQGVFALPSYDAPYNERQQTATYQSEHGGATRPATRKFVERISEGSAASQQDQKPQEHGLWGWLIRYHDEVIAVGTLILGFFAFFQWRDSRRSSERQLRAYVMVEDITLNGFGGAERPSAEITVRNFGSIPATDVQVTGYVVFDDFPLKKSFPPVAHDGTSRRPAGPEDPFLVELHEADFIVDHERSAKMEKSEGAIYVYGAIVYCDGFTDRRTNFRYFTNNEASRRGTMLACADGNEMA